MMKNKQQEDKSRGKSKKCSKDSRVFQVKYNRKSLATVRNMTGQMMDSNENRGKQVVNVFLKKITRTKSQMENPEFEQSVSMQNFKKIVKQDNKQPLKKRLMSSVWKIREEAYAQLREMIEEGKSINQYENILHLFINDSNLQAQINGYKVLLAYVTKNQALSINMYDIYKTLAQNGLSNTKKEISKMSEQIIINLFGKSDRLSSQLMNIFIEQTKNKNQMVVVSCIDIVRVFLVNYGLRKLDSIKPLFNNISHLAQNKSKKIKKSLLDFFKQASKWFNSDQIMECAEIFGQNFELEIKTFTKEYHKQNMILSTNQNSVQINHIISTLKIQTIQKNKIQVSQIQSIFNITTQPSFSVKMNNFLEQLSKIMLLKNATLFLDSFIKLVNAHPKIIVSKNNNQITNIVTRVQFHINSQNLQIAQKAIVLSSHLICILTSSQFIKKLFQSILRKFDQPELSNLICMLVDNSLKFKSIFTLNILFAHLRPHISIAFRKKILSWIKENVEVLILVSTDQQIEEYLNKLQIFEVYESIAQQIIEQIYKQFKKQQPPRHKQTPSQLDVMISKQVFTNIDPHEISFIIQKIVKKFKQQQSILDIHLTLIRIFSNKMLQSQIRLQTFKQYFKEALAVILSLELQIDEISKLLCVLTFSYSLVEINRQSNKSELIIEIFNDFLQRIFKEMNFYKLVESIFVCIKKEMNKKYDRSLNLLIKTIPKLINNTIFCVDKSKNSLYLFEQSMKFIYLNFSQEQYEQGLGLLLKKLRQNLIIFSSLTTLPKLNQISSKFSLIPNVMKFISPFFKKSQFDKSQILISNNALKNLAQSRINESHSSIFQKRIPFQ